MKHAFNIFENLPEGFHVGTEDTIPLATLTLAQSFADYEYPMPSTEVSHSARLRLMYGIFNAQIAHALQVGGVFANEDYSAVMVINPADNMAPLDADALCNELAKNSTQADADNFRAELDRVDELEAQLNLPENTIYIESFAVQTPRQGQKLGSQLMRQLFAQCDKLNRPILLYTNTDKNVSIYKHFGFDIILEDHADDINFHTYFMLHMPNKD